MTLVARITFLVLVGATFSAFFVAQRLKSSPPVIRAASLNRWISPGQKPLEFSIKLTVADDATVDIVDLDGDRVKRLVEAAPMRPWNPLRLTWNGTRDDGERAPDGQYRVRVSLRNEGRFSVIQETMTVDTKPPRPQVCVGAPCSPSVKPQDYKNIMAPGKGPLHVYVKGISTAYQTKFAVFRTDDGPPRQVATFRLKRKSHRAKWEESAALAPGTYLFQASVRDRAGNWGTSPETLEPGAITGRPGLTVRGLAVQPPLRPVTAGSRAQFSVDSRNADYLWRIRRVGEGAIRKRGRATGDEPLLSVRMPSAAPSGAYILEVTAGRWHTSVPFLVQAQQREPMLVVVPAVSWLGSDKVDDSPFDGLPNTLANGSTVHWPRVFAQDGGLPPQFSDDVAKLLVFLDRRKIRYDLTSDLDLDLSRNPRASDRRGVLLAGPATWVTRTLATRLRRYVQEGGHVASFGAGSLRRGVKLSAREDDSGLLSRATQPTDTDPFGARLAKPRTLAAPADLILFEGEDPLGMMTGVVGLPGFTTLEESLPPDGREKLLAGVGQPLTPEETAAAEASGKAARELRPALTAVRLGKGTIIRVGLPEWSAQLDASPEVAQTTRNIVDILRGVTPKIRSER